MRKASLTALAVLLSLVPLQANGQQPGTQQLSLGAVLTGDQEVPGPGDPDGFGNATFTFNQDRTQITVNATFSGIGTAITGAHIHEAPAGVSAGVLVGFIGAMTITDGRINTTVAIEPATANRIIANPSGFYFNIHTTAHPPGAIRGQLTSTSGAVFIGDMRGVREVPGPGHSSALGSFVVSINGSRDLLSYAIATTGLLNISASHIHGPNGSEGVAAGVFVGLAAGSEYVNGQAQGTVPITPQQAAAIIANPANFYVNVHSTDFPAGAIRGQLVAASGGATGNTIFLPVIGRVSNAVDTFVTNVRIFNTSFDEFAVVTIEFFPAGGSTQIASVRVQPRGVAVLDDIAMTLFGQSSAIGGARVSSPTRVIATARIFADRRSAGGGTFGQFFNEVRMPPRRGILTQVSHTPGASGFRTNVGFFNPNDVTTTVRFELRDAEGVAVASTTTMLAPRSFSQMPLHQLFPSVQTLANGTLTFDASAPTIAYISVLDNVTTDPLAVVAVQDTADATTP